MKTDIHPVGVELYFLPVEMRVPLQCGSQTLASVLCVRVRMTVAAGRTKRAHGWGETLLSMPWAWPSQRSYQDRCDAMQDFCRRLAQAWTGCAEKGHPIEVGHRFNESVLPDLLTEFNAERGTGAEPMPPLAALVCNAAFDIALHDAYGRLHDCPVYSTYNRKYMNVDLARFLEPATGSRVSFAGKYPADFLCLPPAEQLPAWHLVEDRDVLDASELSGKEPSDGYPVLLPGWIKRDGLKCLAVKLRGDDAAWDYDRLVRVGEIAIEHKALWLSADFNCAVTDPAYVTAILDRLMTEQPRIYQMILYVEQPFPYDLEANPIDVHCVSARKPLFMDESAHDWRLIRLGRQLGWTGVALKTCKTQTGALLSLCWAKAHGMTVMVQDLTNPMLAQIPHCLLAAHAGTIMGVGTNAMQFCPGASAPEEAVHPGLYRRRDGQVDLSTLTGPGFGYRLEEMDRQLPPKDASSSKR